jgi:uncharacterized protein (TIGR02597 family)
MNLNHHRGTFGRSRLAALGMGFLLALLPMVAFAVESPPVGFITIPLSGNADGVVSLPLQRPAVAEFNEGDFGNATQMYVAYPETLTPNQYVYAAGTQPNTYYVQFIGGPMPGACFPIVANDDSTITLNTYGQDLSVIFDQPGISGVAFLIVPYWTLNTVFPEGQGIFPTSTFSVLQRYSEILLPDTTDAGINLAAPSEYYFYNGTANVGPGWRRIGGSISETSNDTLLPPNNYFIVRLNTANSTAFTVVGEALTANYTATLSTLQSNTQQDIPVAVNVPVPITLIGSNLVGSGAFVQSPSFSATQRNDELLVYSYPITVQNPAASQSYYYYNGTSDGGPGWRLIGGNITAIYDNSQIFQPGQGYIIRKQETPEPQTWTWSFTPSYVPLLP